MKPPGPDVNQRLENRNSKIPSRREYPFLLRSYDQAAVVALLLLSVVVAAVCFAFQTNLRQEFMDIDRAPDRSAQYLVDINSADWPEIANLPGIGPKLANAIVEYRMEHGEYTTHEQLTLVSGIGNSKLSDLRPFLAPIPLQEDE